VHLILTNSVLSPAADLKSKSLTYVGTKRFSRAVDGALLELHAPDAPRGARRGPEVPAGARTPPVCSALPLTR